MKPMFKGTGKADWLQIGRTYKVSVHHGGDEGIEDEGGMHWSYPAETKHLVREGYLIEVKDLGMEENE